MMLRSRAHHAWITLFLGLIFCGLAHGIGPGAIIPGRVYIPTGGYVRAAQAFQFTRNAASIMQLAPGPPRAKAMEGTKHMPVILVTFPGVVGPFPPNAYSNALFRWGSPSNSPPHTVTQYFKDMSNGRLNVTGEVYGWYSLPKNSAYYERNDHGKSGANIAEMLDAAFKAADANIDFGLYDNDGPDGIPNSGDDDGKVDVAIVVQSLSGGECEGGKGGIWSQEYQYSKLPGRTNAFVTSAIRKDAQGKPKLNLDGTFQHIVIDDYTIEPARQCGDGPPQLVQIGVFCHEFGHALGLPDLYDRNVQSAGIGDWCVMSYGCYGGDAQSADTPVHFSAWAEQYLGWASVTKISRSGDYILEPVESRNMLYRIDVPNSDGMEYFLLENKNCQPIYPNPQRVNWDQHLPHSGVAVWHVDDRVGSDSGFWPFALLGQGQNDSPSLPNADASGFLPTHSPVSLIQQDKQMHLEHLSNYGNAEDLYVEQNTFQDDPTFAAGSRAYDGTATMIAISNFNTQTGEVSIYIPTSSGISPVSSDLTLGTQPYSVPAVAPAHAERAGVPAWTREVQLTTALLEQPGTPSLSAPMKAAVEQLSDRAIESLPVTPAKKLELRTEAARLRTRTVANAETADSNVVSQAFVKLNSQHLTLPEATLQFTPSHSDIEALDGLKFPVQEASKLEDATMELRTKLKPFVHDVPLMPQSRDSNSLRQSFQQTIAISGAKLPVWGAGIECYYQAGEYLNKVRSTVISPADLKVTGDPSHESTDTIRSVVAKAIGLRGNATNRILSCEQGVFLPDHDPAKGVVSFRVQVSGSYQEPISIYYDPAKRTIMKIE